MPDADRVLKEQSMVVRRTDKRDFGLATGWSEEDGTTTTYQPNARFAGNHRRIETGPVPRAKRARALPPPPPPRPVPATDLYARKPSGVQPKVPSPAAKELELDASDLHGNPFARRRSASSASLWNTLGFAGLFASVLIGRVVVEASQARGAESRSNVQPAAAVAGSAGVGSDAPAADNRNESGLAPETHAGDNSHADGAAPSGSARRADGNGAAHSAEPTAPSSARRADGNGAAHSAEPTAPSGARRADSSAQSDAAPEQPAAAEASRPKAQRSKSVRPESSDWRDGPMEPAVSNTPPEPAQPSAPAEPAALGTLRINSRPWSQVYLDGRLVGNTPQMSLQVPAGRYTVRLANPELGMSKTIFVTVGAGESVTRVESLE